VRVRVFVEVVEVRTGVAGGSDDGETVEGAVEAAGSMHVDGEHAGV